MYMSEGLAPGFATRKLESPTAKVGWLGALNISTRNSSFFDSVIGKTFRMPRSQLKNAGPLKALRGRFPTVPGCGLQKPPETRGVQVKASLGAPRPSGPINLVLMSNSSPFDGYAPSWPAICCGVDGVYAVLVSSDRAERFRVPSPDKIENGAPLCQVKIDDMIQPETNRFSTPFEGAQWRPLPTGNSYRKLALKACDRSKFARARSKPGCALSR